MEYKMPSMSDKNFQLSEVESKSAYNGKEYENGVFVGKGATWNNLDSGGRDGSGLAYADIMLPGFFSKQDLQRFVNEGHAMRGHGKQGDSRTYGLEKAIGLPIDAKDTGKGLEVAFAYHGTPDAQNERTKIQERLALGKSAPLSIWYAARKYEKFQGKAAVEGAIQKFVAPEFQSDALSRSANYHYIRVLKEGKLIGVDSVYEGMDQYAGVIASKEANATATITETKIAPRETPWNGTKAIENLRTVSGDEVTAEYGKCFLYCEQGKEESFDAYKYPVAEIVNGETVIVAKAVYAVAAMLNGKSTEMPDELRGALKQKVSDLYGKLRTEFSDNAIIPPWERKSANAPMFSAKHTFESYEAKGAFEDTLTEKITNPYFLFDVWMSARCDVRNMAWINEQAGTAFDEQSALKEVNAEFYARLDAADAEEFTESSADGDANGDDAPDEMKQAVNADSLANQASGLEYLATRLESRADRLIELRGKEARTLSDATMNPLEDVGHALVAHGNSVIGHGNKILAMTKAQRDKVAAKKAAKAKGKEAEPVITEPVVEQKLELDNAARLEKLRAIEKRYSFLNI